MATFHLFVFFQLICCIYVLCRTLQQDLANIQDRLDALGDEFKEVRPKIVENNRRIEERMKSIKEGEGKFRLLSLEINELESFEYPQEVEISVMVNFFFELIFFSTIYIQRMFHSEKRSGRTNEIIGSG